MTWEKLKRRKAAATLLRDASATAPEAWPTAIDLAARLVCRRQGSPMLVLSPHGTVVSVPLHAIPDVAPLLEELARFAAEELGCERG